MLHVRSTTLLVLPLLFTPFVVCGQTIDSVQTRSSSPADSKQSSEQPPAAAVSPIPRDAPRMSRETRFQIIRDFETQLVYARTAFPMGAKGLHLKEGEVTPNGDELHQGLPLWGPSIN